MDVTSNKDFFGFVSIEDFFTSLFGTKTMILNLMGSLIAVISGLLTDYVWDTYEAIYVLWLLMIGDWITGLSYAIKEKIYWSRKNFRMPIYFLCTTTLISISWWLAKSNILFIPLPSIVYGGFCAVYLTSLVENMSKLEWIPPSIAEAIANRFGLQEVLKKIDKKEKEDQEKESLS